MKILKHFLLLSCLIIPQIDLSASSLPSQFEHPNMLYNRALEEYEKNNIGMAMYSLKKAVLLNPSDPDIRRFYFKLRKEVGVSDFLSTDRISSRIFATVFSAIDPQWSSLIGSMLFIAASIGVALVLLRKYILPKKNILVLTCFFFILSGLFILQALVQYYIFFDTQERVLIESTDLYEEPDTKSEIFAKISSGSEVKVIDQINEFLLVRTLDNREAWILTNNAPPLFDNIKNQQTK